MSLKRKFDECSENTINTLYEYVPEIAFTSESFIKSVVDDLNKFCKVWNLSWTPNKSQDNVYEYNKFIEFETHVTLLPITLPFDLIPKLQQMIEKTAGTALRSVVFDFDKQKNTISFQCDCVFYDEGYYVKCGNCGNCWDGNAQCMCDQNN